jgi:hypothetical protein
MTRRIDHRLDRIAQRLNQAARIKPNLDEHLATQLAYCDTRQANETGISSNTINDPVIARIMTRAAIVERSGKVEQRVVDLELAVNALDDAMRDAWGQDRPDMADEAPICHMAGCAREVGSWRRADGGYSFRMSGDYGGLCDAHRVAAMRQAGAA